MISSTIGYIMVITIALLNQVNGEKYTDGVQIRNILLEKRYAAPRTCCLIQKCEDIPLNTENHNAYQCYKKEVCGDICYKGNYRRAPLPYSPHTPGYRIKQYITKQYCKFDQCVDYNFDCDRCPNPSKPAFSIYALKSDCIDCYY